MNDTEKQSKTIEMLADHELAIGRLYKVYAEKFPYYKDFWLTLSGEETQHANWINELESKIEEDSIHFNPDRFQIPAIQHSLNYAQKMLAKAQGSDLDLVSALSTASSIEDALIENRFFEIFEADSAELKQTLRKLAQATEDHRQRILKVKAENK
jgi:rubrerythrin